MSRILSLLVASIILAGCHSREEALNDGNLEYLEAKALWPKEIEKSRMMMIEAAKKGHPKACFAVYQYTDEELKGFGSTVEDAKINLLLKVVDWERELAESALADIYLNSEKLERNIMGRELSKKLADQKNVSYLKRHGKACFNGTGGEVNYPEAYFYLSCYANSVHPDSPSGVEVNQIREKLVSLIEVEKLINILKQVDYEYPYSNRIQDYRESTQELEERKVRYLEFEKRHRGEIGLEYFVAIPSEDFDPFQDEPSWDWRIKKTF